MKIQKIMSLLKKSKRIYLAYKDGKQWIGDGAAFYAIHNLPELDEDIILAMLDVPEDKRSSYTVETIDWLPFFDEDYSREPAEQVGDTLYTHYGRTLQAFSFGDSFVYMIDIKYLKPIEIDFFGYGTAFVCKSENGEATIVIRDGLVSLAVVKPIRIGAEFIEEIKSLASKFKAEEAEIHD